MILGYLLINVSIPEGMVTLLTRTLHEDSDNATLTCLSVVLSVIFLALQSIIRPKLLKKSRPSKGRTVSATTKVQRNERLRLRIWISHFAWPWHRMPSPVAEERDIGDGSKTIPLVSSGGIMETLAPVSTMNLNFVAPS